MDKNKRAICSLRTMSQHVYMFAKFVKFETLQKLDWLKIGLCVFKDFNKEYFKKFEIKKYQIREAATKEVFCEKDVLKLLVISLKLIYFFIASFIEDFSVKNYM